MSIVLLIDGVAAVCFLAAAVVAAENYAATVDISEYWLVFATAAGAGFLWAGSSIVQPLFPAVTGAMVAVQSVALTGFAVAAVLAATITVSAQILPSDTVDQTVEAVERRVRV